MVLQGSPRSPDIHDLSECHNWGGDAVSRVTILSLSHRQFQILSWNPDVKYYFIPILNMSLNFIQSLPEFILSYPPHFNFIHLSLPKIIKVLSFYPETASASHHHPYDLGRHLLPPISITLLTLTPKISVRSLENHLKTTISDIS